MVGTVLGWRMGVHERHFNTRLRQRGNLIPGQNITQALQDGLRRAVNQVLATTPDLHDQDRLYFTIGSNVNGQEKLGHPHPK